MHYLVGVLRGDLRRLTSGKRSDLLACSLAGVVVSAAGVLSDPTGGGAVDSAKAVAGVATTMSASAVSA